MLDQIADQALEVYWQAMAFARTVQTTEVRQSGKESRSWYITRRELDHGGLEAMLRDSEPVLWRRRLVRDLVAWLSTMKVEQSTHEGATEEDIADAWDRLGVVAAW